VVLVTSGQRPLDAARWSGEAGAVTAVPLRPFTESESRGLLAARGVTAEPVVAEVLRLTDGLPVLVSTLAQAGPTAADEIPDPSSTAVERFLKWEQDPVRRSVALVCALPRRLDLDVLVASAGCTEEEAEALFTWLRGLPFVTDRGDRVQYHDMVRAPMLRLQRHRSPRGWTARHRQLAGTFGQWRAETEAELGEASTWADEEWRGARIEESYHRLCAGPRSALPDVLRDVVEACDQEKAVARRWAGLLREAGQDAGAEAVAAWGEALTAALDGDGVSAAVTLLLNGATDDGFPCDLDARTRALAYAVRAEESLRAGGYGAAVDDYDHALRLDPGLARAHRGRAMAHAELDDYGTAIEDLDRALAAAPDDAWLYCLRGEYKRIAGRTTEALADLDRGIALDPAREFAWASRGTVRLALGNTDGALADLSRALDLRPDYAWALIRRARVWRARDEHARRLADLDRGVAVEPGWSWAHCERGDALRAVGRHEEAVTDYGRAIALDPAYASAHASRSASLSALGHHDRALADLDRALALRPDYVWALTRRAEVHLALRDPARAAADAERALALSPSDTAARALHARALGPAGARHEE
jgi:tetratricopeptide (TPR) repeat protein